MSEVEIYASDDLMTRAENIVKMMGYTGAIGGYVINIYRLLQAYEKIDEEAKETN